MDEGLIEAVDVVRGFVECKINGLKDQRFANMEGKLISYVGVVTPEIKVEKVGNAEKDRF